MAFCSNCGTQVDDSVKFCPSCGGAITATQPAQQQYQQQQAPQQQYQQQQYQQPGYQQPPVYQQPIMPGAPGQADIRDAQENKTMAIVAYILFFVPLLSGAHKTSPFAKYHTNQGTILFFLSLAYGIVFQILCAIIRVEQVVFGFPTGIYITPSWLITILWILSLGILALAIYGIYNAATGKMKPLPGIGSFTVIK